MEKQVKKAIIVGASSGIGLEVARLLLQEGWTLGVAARRLDRLQKLKSEWGSQVEVARLDVISADSKDILQQLIKTLGDIDLFFYAAGVGRQNRNLTEEIEITTVRTNAVGFTRMIGEAYRYFAARGGGHIAAITSIAGTKGLGPAPSYSATKALQATYLEALEQLASQQGLNIRFTDIRPGFVDTDLLNGEFHYPMLMKPEAVARDIVNAIHQQRHVRIIDWRYRLLTALWRCIPRWLWRRFRL